MTSRRPPLEGACSGYASGVLSASSLGYPLRGSPAVGVRRPGTLGSRGGSATATLATFARSLPVPLDAISSSLHRPLRGTPRFAQGSPSGSARPPPCPACAR